jgi:hypothetical protein
MCGGRHRKIPEHGGVGHGLCLDFVGLGLTVQTKNPQDFMLKMNEMTQI